MPFRWKRKEADGLFNQLKKFVDDLLDENEQLRNLLASYSNEAEIARLEKEIDHIRSHSLFVMSDKEMEEVKAFYYQHQQTCGGSTHYLMKPTGIGMVLVVKCSECQTEKDVTDVGSW